MKFKETLYIHGVELTVTGYYTLDTGDRDTQGIYECEIEDVKADGITITDLLSERVFREIEEELSEIHN